MRHITLLIENADEKEIEKLKDYCTKNSLDFNYRYGREYKFGLREYLDKGIAPLYYFTIFSNTEGFNKLNSFMENRLILTDYAEICNIADLDDNFEKQFSELIEKCRKSIDDTLNLNREFLNFLMPIKDIALLEEIKKYSCHFNERQKETIENRICVLKKEDFKFKEEMIEVAKSLSKDVKLLREKTGMNRREFCDYFGIPYRTVEDWENKKSTCSSYLFDLMEEKLYREGKFIYEYRN